jgi:hypothetical protein
MDTQTPLERGLLQPVSVPGGQGDALDRWVPSDAKPFTPNDFNGSFPEEQAAVELDENLRTSYKRLEVSFLGDLDILAIGDSDIRTRR